MNAGGPRPGAERIDELSARLTLLNDLAVASAQMDPVYLIDGALRRVAEVFDCPFGAAFLREGIELHNVSIFGVRPEAAQDARVVRVGAGPVGAAVLRRDVAVFASPEEAGAAFAESVRGEALRSVAGVPLLTTGEPVGGLALGRRSDAPFTDEEQRFLKAIGAQLGVAVQNARLFASTRRQLSHLEAVRSLALRIFVQPPGGGRPLLLDGCREVASALDAPVAVAYLVSEDGRTLRRQAIHGEFPACEELRLDVPGVGADVVRSGQAEQTPDAAGDPRCAWLLDEQTPRMSLLAVPLGLGGRTLGVLYVGDRQGRVFTDDEVGLARAMSAALAVGLENLGLKVDLDRSHAELVRTQAELLQRERLAALGSVSAAVAHEIRNPLGVIFNAIGMLRRHRATSDEEGRSLVDMVGEEAERLNRIVSDLLGFARPPLAAIRPTELGPVVQEAVRAALAGSQAPVESWIELDRGLAPVAVDAGLLRQALINVVLNAQQAVGRGGRVRVRTAAAGAFAVVEVTDTGPGIPEEVRPRIFEPFFTTKTRGTGLGLAIVKHVVELHGGTIEVEPAEGGGTRVTLQFPFAAGSGGPPRP